MMKKNALLIGILVVGLSAPRLQAQTLFVPQHLKPFSSETNYMSVPGHLRWSNYLETRDWMCQGLVRLSEQYIDNQEGGADAVSGMDINSVTPQTVHYSLQVNEGAIQNLPYRASAVRLKSIFGDAIQVDFDFNFCIGPSHHYSFVRFVAPNGLLDKVGNTFDSQNNNRAQQYRFHLEYSQNGSLLLIDEVSQKKIQARYEGGVFYLPDLTPVADK